MVTISSLLCFSTISKRKVRLLQSLRSHMLTSLILNPSKTSAGKWTSHPKCCENIFVGGRGGEGGGGSEAPQTLLSRAGKPLMLKGPVKPVVRPWSASSFDCTTAKLQQCWQYATVSARTHKWMLRGVTVPAGCDFRAAHRLCLVREACAKASIFVALDSTGNT